MSNADSMMIIALFVLTILHATVNAVIIRDRIEDTCGEVAP